MKPITNYFRKSTPLLVLAVSGGFASHLFAADEQSTDKQNQAYRQAIAQEALQKDLAESQAELVSMRDEMKELLPEDVAVIDRAFKQIDSLSSNEMQAAIASLRAAGRSGDIKTRLDDLAAAFKSQTVAVSEIKRISADLSARAVRDDIIQKLIDVLKRQAADMDEVARIAQSNLTPAMLRDALMRRHQVVSGDQVTVTDDVNICIQEITSAAANLPDEARKFMADASAIITRQKLAENANSAVTLTRDGPFDQAVAAQGAVANTLAMVIHALSSDSQTLDQLRQMSTDLGTMSGDQKQVAASMQAERRAIPYPLQMRQGDLSDSVTALRAQVQVLNPQAAGEAQLGRDSMEKVVAITSQGQREDKTAIAPAQQYAVAELDAAKRDIDKQIADLELALQKELNPAPDAGTPATGVATATEPAQPEAAPGQGDGNTPDANAGAGAPGQGDNGKGDGNAAGAGAGKTGMGTGQGPMITGATGTTGQGVENTNLDGQSKGMAGGAPGELGDYAGAGGANQTPVQVVSGLNSHDRAAVSQLQHEKPPREFVPDVQQYYRNLADGAGL